MKWWVFVVRENHANAAVGPYKSEEEAVEEMNDGLQTQILCEEDAVDVIVIPRKRRPYKCDMYLMA